MQEQYWLVCQWQMLSMQQEELLLSLLLLTVCPVGFFGKWCEEQCNCIHGLSCHHQTGACHCEKGWRGRHCDRRECLLGVYGRKFRSACTLLPNPELMTGSFHSCIALWGWFGSAHGNGCSRSIGRGNFALSCQLLQLACLAAMVWAVPRGAGVPWVHPAITWRASADVLQDSLATAVRKVSLLSEYKYFPCKLIKKLIS